MSDSITLVVPRDFANEVVEALEGLIEQWIATEESMESGLCRDDVLTFACDSPEQALENAGRYTAIRDSLVAQMQT